MRSRCPAEPAIRGFCRIRPGTERRARTTVVISSIWGPVASSPESHRLGRYPMTTIPSAAIVVYDPELAGPEHVTLAGFLGGYRGLPRDAYALDLRQFVAFCDERHLGLFEVRRSDIEALGLKRGHRTLTILRS